MTVFTGIQKQLSEDKKIMEGIIALSTLIAFTNRQVNLKVKSSYPFL
jgi:hypothetical protein